MDEVHTHHEEIDEAATEKSGSAGLVFLTIFILALIGALAAFPKWIAEVPPVKAAIENPKWWTENIGEYHPVILHLPIGIVFLTLFMEVCSWLSFGKYRPMTSVGLFLGVITGALACVTGYIDMHIGGYTGDDWNNHMWAGIAFVGILGLAFLAKLWGRRSGSRGPVYGILLFGAAGVMGFGAHIGGEKIHNTDPFKNTLVGLNVIEDPDAPKQGDAEDEVITDVPKPSAPQDRLAFAHVVMPILKSKCLACHSVNEKKKGGLLMDTYADLLVGGSSQDGDDYRTLVPGDAKASYMIEVLNLPMDDDMHMPPEKKTQLEPHELDILTWWVSSIPNSETLDDKTLAEMGAPENIIAGAAKLVTPEELKAAEDAKAAAEAKAEAEKIAKREALQTALDELKEDEVFKTSLNYVSQDSTDLEFTAVSQRASFGDDSLVKLAPVSEALSVVKLSATSVTEQALINELPKMKNLKRLDLSQTETGDAVLEVVAKLENLEWLNLYGTKVTDEGILKLKSLTKLKDLYLWQSQATPEGVEALKRDLPGLDANFGVN